MKNVGIKFLLVMFFGTNLWAAKPPVSTGFEVFTIGQVQLGQTTQKDLENLGATTTNGEEFILKGGHFWVNPANSLVYSFTREVHQTWPTTWTASGLLASFNSDDILKWIQKNGYRAVKMKNEIDGTKISDKKVFVVKFYLNDQDKLSNVMLFCTARP